VRCASRDNLEALATFSSPHVRACLTSPQPQQQHKDIFIFHLIHFTLQMY
jgi:hypothetical protein